MGGMWANLIHMPGDTARSSDGQQDSPDIIKLGTSRIQSITTLNFGSKKEA